MNFQKISQKIGKMSPSGPLYISIDSPPGIASTTFFIDLLRSPGLRLEIFDVKFFVKKCLKSVILEIFDTKDFPQKKV